MSGHTCVVPPETPVERADIAQDLWEGGRYPFARAVRGQVSYFAASHMAPDVWVTESGPGTHSFTDFNGTTSIYNV